MSKIFDDILKEFINKELDSVKSDKERITEEKWRIRTEICNLFNVDCLKRSDEQKERLKFSQNYYNVLNEQYRLLCKRDISLYRLIANIGEAAMEESLVRF